MGIPWESRSKTAPPTLRNYYKRCTPMNEQQFIRALSTCLESYGKKLSAPVGKFWIQSLKEGNLSLDDAAAALAKHAIDPEVGQYPPRVADVSRYCGVKRRTFTDSQIAELRLKQTAKLTKDEQTALGIYFMPGSGMCYPADYTVIV